jgi:hypothetical protein
MSGSPVEPAPVPMSLGYQRPALRAGALLFARSVRPCFSTSGNDMQPGEPSERLSGMELRRCA